MMAPDSKRVTEVLGSSMAGTRPLGLMDSKGSGLGCQEGLCAALLWVFIENTNLCGGR
jgi:hypothetical protein